MESGMDFFMSLFPRFVGVLLPFAPAFNVTTQGGQPKAQVVRPKEGVYNLYTPVLNEF
jgi:hypothetical protein